MFVDYIGQKGEQMVNITLTDPRQGIGNMVLTGNKNKIEIIEND